MTLRDALVAEIGFEAAVTRRVLERVPADRLAWKPHPKSMTVGELALHVASSPGDLAEWLSQPTTDLGNDGHPPGQPAALDEVLAVHDASVAKAVGFIDGLPDEAFATAWRLTRHGAELITLPRATAVRHFLLNHWYHHRGQLSVYLRLLGVPVPPIYGPTADEDPFVPEASRPPVVV